MSYFVHPNGICESKNIGENTRVWAFTHVLPGAVIGADCNVCDNVFIENDVVIGNRVTIKCGVQIWDGITIEDDVFIGPNVTFTNDRFPRSRQYPEEFAKTTVQKGASIGANATILPGITLGKNSMIGAGSVVVKSVPANAIVIGNPARITGYANTTKSQLTEKNNSEIEVGVYPSKVKGVSWHVFQNIEDLRGNLSFGEFEKHVPFMPKRYFIIYKVGSSEIRGEHAHKECAQFLICIKGACSVIADDGTHREEFRLEKPYHGLYLPPMTWGIQYRYDADAILLVFASDYYSENDYIRNYSDFQKHLSG